MLIAKSLGAEILLALNIVSLILGADPLLSGRLEKDVNGETLYRVTF